MEKALDPNMASGDLALPATPDLPAMASTLTNYNNVNVNVAMPSIHMSMQSNRTPFLVRALWFFCVGWWLSAFFIFFGYLFTLSIILMPVGLWMLNRVPQAQTLRARNVSMKTEFKDGAIFFTESRTPQHPWYVRLVYLVFVGWWAGLAWLLASWALSILIVTLPVSIWMVDRAPQVITLQKN